MQQSFLATTGNNRFHCKLHISQLLFYFLRSDFHHPNLINTPRTKVCKFRRNYFVRKHKHELGRFIPAKGHMSKQLMGSAILPDR